MAKARTDLVPASVSKNLDSLLEHFGLEARALGAKHDAYIDCVKTAELYMKLSEEKDAKKKRKKANLETIRM